MTGDERNDTILTPKPAPETALDSVPGVAGALEDEYEKVRRFVDEDTLGPYSPTSLLIHGPSGAGKRELARAIVGELGARGYEYDWLESVYTEEMSGPDEMETLFREARRRSPIVIVADFFSDMHGLDAARKYRNAVSTSMVQEAEILIVGIIDEVDLRHDYMREYFRTAPLKINLEEPDRARRRAILRDEVESAIERGVLDATPDRIDFDSLAVEAQEFSVDDVRTVVQRVVMDWSAQDEAVTSIEDALFEAIGAVGNERLESVREEAFLQGFEVPSTTWDDIGGLEETKEQLVESIRQSQVWDEAYEVWNVSAGGGILLYGPPGTGKTLLVQALANETDRAFIPVKAPEIKNPMFSSPAKIISGLFDQARKNAPSIIFFDEFDSLGGQRGAVNGTSDDTVNALLTELDGLEEMGDVVVVAATNRPETLDDALRRPGRFDEHIEVPPPDKATRQDIFRVHTREFPLADDVTPQWFTRLIGDLTGAHIEAICDRAARVALRGTDAENIEGVIVTRADFEQAEKEFSRDRVNSSNTKADPGFQ